MKVLIILVLPFLLPMIAYILIYFKETKKSKS